MQKWSANKPRVRSPQGDASQRFYCRVIHDEWDTIAAAREQ